ncbi:MAG: SDR family oxidoreductase [Gammaproteobacteria bacterium]|nr:SDR family NAD(P)-dependent oxidoreductase [Gammaproteobacteria bacterium]MXY30757.1 SDR family oxidoreductase [Gammaproteobacteria bacterium]MYD00393.1 SDR family oxidoreductase [Gammaproteobacteria bacterium]MYF61171.1 SDR family oxidoreductase [Gammaproteobacteria bacterium]
MPALSVARPLSVTGIDVLVTGAGRGLGRGIAQAMAAAGARVWLVSEVREELEWTASDIRAAGGEARILVADLGREDERNGLIRNLRKGARRLRVIVNNAGVLEREPVASLDSAHWRRIMGVNLEAPVFLTRDLLPLLGDDGGSVINVSSRAGTAAFARQAAYCASKFGMEAFTRCLALELAGLPVSVNTVTPGLPIKPTSLTQRDAERADAATRAGWRDPVRLGPAFLFLAGLRGQISGCRFDAWTLTQALERWGTRGVMTRIHEIAEYTSEAVG